MHLLHLFWGSSGCFNPHSSPYQHNSWVSPVLLLQHIRGFTSYVPTHDSGLNRDTAAQSPARGRLGPGTRRWVPDRGSPCRGTGRTCAGRGRAPGRPRTTRRAAAHAAGRTDPSTGLSRTPRGSGAAGPWPAGFRLSPAPGARVPAPRRALTTSGCAALPLAAADPQPIGYLLLLPLPFPLPIGSPFRT